MVLLAPRSTSVKHLTVPYPKAMRQFDFPLKDETSEMGKEQICR